MNSVYKWQQTRC